MYKAHVEMTIITKTGETVFTGSTIAEAMEVLVREQAEEDLINKKAAAEKHIRIINATTEETVLVGWMTLEVFLASVTALNGSKLWNAEAEEIFRESHPNGVADQAGNCKFEIKEAA